MSTCVYSNLDPHMLHNTALNLRLLYQRDGILIFPGLLNQMSEFVDYKEDLHALVGHLMRLEGLKAIPEDSLDQSISRLAKANRSAIGALYNIGTTPNKLISGGRLKNCAVFTQLASVLLGPDVMLGTPGYSDTLHVFPPGSSSYRFNLPIHQDYPYLLQSPQQVTFWINFGQAWPDVGGVTAWVGSHGLGAVKSEKNPNGHYESVVAPDVLSRFKAIDYVGGVGDLVVFNSLLLHRSNYNTTPDHSRIVQLFRYSNLNHPDSRAFNWASAGDPGAPPTFEAVFAHLKQPQ